MGSDFDGVCPVRSRYPVQGLNPVLTGVRPSSMMGLIGCVSGDGRERKKNLQTGILNPSISVTRWFLTNSFSYPPLSLRTSEMNFTL